MKLNEVDLTLNEGQFTTNLKAIGASVFGGKEAAQQILAKKQFVDTFLKKMSTMLATQWPAIERAKKEELINQQKAQQAQAEKEKAMATKQAAQPSTIIDPRTGKPFVQTASESYNLFRRKFDKLLKEATAQEMNPEYRMSDYIMQVLPKYMSSIDLTPYMGNLANFAKQIESTYQSNHAIPTIKALGAYLFDIVQQYKQREQGMPQPDEEQPDQKVSSVLKTIGTMTDKEKQQLMTMLQPQQPKS